MRYRPINSDPLDPRLGRFIPDDWKHYERWALTSDTVPEAPTPVVIGVNWYSNFDRPVQKGREWWIGEGDLGHIRGGHCVCVQSFNLKDHQAWWDFYDQGREGACVGFGSSRMMTLLDRGRYNARWLWDRAKERDEWSDTNPGDDNGTSVRAAMEVLRDLGHVKWRKSSMEELDHVGRTNLTPDNQRGISTYRWASSVDEMRSVLSSPAHERRGAFPILNSWGRDYPRVVWIPYATMQRLIDEDGEVALVTDR
jgi:hypothetical protein